VHILLCKRGADVTHLVVFHAKVQQEYIWVVVRREQNFAYILLLVLPQSNTSGVFMTLLSWSILHQVQCTCSAQWYYFVSGHMG